MVRYFSIALLLAVNVAWADEDVSSDAEAVKTAENAAGVGADASIADKRLPPVFPGEEINDGGNKMKVWSTTGEVPVAQPPQPWNNNPNGVVHGNGVGGVIVDGRVDRRTDRR